MTSPNRLPNRPTDTRENTLRAMIFAAFGLVLFDELIVRSTQQRSFTPGVYACVGILVYMFAGKWQTTTKALALLALTLIALWRLVALIRGPEWAVQLS